MFNSIEEVFNYYRNDKNIVNVGFSHKLTNNIHTKESCVTFGVLVKKKDNINPDYYIPETINIAGTDYKTDVVKSVIMTPISTPVNPNDPFDDWRRIPPVANDFYNRPIQGGLSIGIGTLGVLCKDNDTGALCLLSNAHVLAKNNSKPVLKRDILKNYIPGDGMIAQGSIIGKRYKNIFIDPDDTNYVDCAIGTIRKEDIDLILSRRQFGLSFPQVWKFATTAELNSILLGMRVYHSGGKTGAKGEIKTLPDGREMVTKLFINNILSSTVGPYDENVYPYYAAWGNLFSVIATETDVHGIPKYIPVYLGDSGSVLIGEFADGFAVYGDWEPKIYNNNIVVKYNSNYYKSYPNLQTNPEDIPGISNKWILVQNGEMKVIGLTVSANIESSPWNATFCRIDTVCSMLNISEWPEDELIPGQGAELNYLDHDNPEYLDVEGLDGDLFKEVNGKKYWCIGTVRKAAEGEEES